MNILLHDSIDKLYGDYTLVHSSEYGFIHIKGKNRASELIGTFSKDNGCGTIGSIEGIGVGHKLMILFLIEMYYYKVETIHLEAVPVVTRGNKFVTHEHLEKFYQGFGFVKNPIAQNTDYPHKVPMILQEWDGLINQVQEYIRRAMLQT